jgi:parallel beta-helix repeat protein
VGSTVDRNVCFENYGAGVMVLATSNGNTITRNSFYDNGTIAGDGGGGATGQIGIDLLDNGDDDKGGSAPFFTLNDLGDIDVDGNRLFNFPILASASLSGANLIVSGWARSGSTIELFVADVDASGFGEGRTYLATIVEGSAADSDGTNSLYGPGAINGLAQGTDLTSRYRITIPLPAGVGVGTVVTATATDASGDTSEFSGNATVGFTPALTKRAFQSDGTPIPNGATLPTGTPVKFLVYVNNAGGALTDVRVADVLDPLFAYVGGSIRIDDSYTCVATPCDAADEAAIFAAVDAATADCHGSALPCTDVAGDDVADYAPGALPNPTLSFGGPSNAQLDLAAGRVWAVLFTVLMQ